MMKGRLRDLTRGMDGSQIISVAVDGDFRDTFDELKDKDVTVEIKRFRKKRSLDANAFCWKLVNEIAGKLQEKEPRHGWTPVEVYRDAIRNIAGACTVHCIPNSQVDQFVEDWQSLGIGFQVETFPSQIQGCTNGYFWKGSHLYNSQQMSVLIDILIQQAETLGIPTISDEEAERLKGNWKKGEKKDGNRSQVTEDNSEARHTEVPA